MKLKFLYWDNSKTKWVKDHFEAPIVLECIMPKGTLLTEVDKIFEGKVGNNPQKMKHIGVEIILLPSSSKNLLDKIWAFLVEYWQNMVDCPFGDYEEIKK